MVLCLINLIFTHPISYSLKVQRAFKSMKKTHTNPRLPAENWSKRLARIVWMLAFCVFTPVSPPPTNRFPDQASHVSVVTCSKTSDKLQGRDFQVNIGCLPLVRINLLGWPVNNGKELSKISKPTERDGANTICNSISRRYCLRLIRDWKLENVRNGKEICTVPIRTEIEDHLWR